MDTYQPRIVDTELDTLAEGLPAVVVEGPRAVGKTETALRRASTVHRLDDERQPCHRVPTSELSTGNNAANRPTP